MAMTITARRKENFGSVTAHLLTVDITSYTTNGEDVSASALEVGSSSVLYLQATPTEYRYAYRWDKTNDKILLAGPQVTATDGSAVATEILPDIKGGETGNQTTGGAAAVNGAYVIALGDADTSLRSTIASQPDYARSLVVQFSSAGGGTLPSDMGNCTLIGTDQFGNAVNETVDLSGLNDVVLGAGDEVWIASTNVYATLTSAQLSVDVTATVADVDYSIGLGTKVALSKQLDTPASADVKRVQKNSAAVGSGTYTVDTTNHAVEMGADLADDDELYIQYVYDQDSVDVDANPAELTELASATDGGTWDLLVLTPGG